MGGWLTPFSKSLLFAKIALNMSFLHFYPKKLIYKIINQESISIKQAFLPFQGAKGTLKRKKSMCLFEDAPLGQA